MINQLTVAALKWINGSLFNQQINSQQKFRLWLKTQHMNEKVYFINWAGRTLKTIQLCWSSIFSIMKYSDKATSIRDAQFPQSSTRSPKTENIWCMILIWQSESTESTVHLRNHNCFISFLSISSFFLIFFFKQGRVLTKYLKRIKIR